MSFTRQLRELVDIVNRVKWEHTIKECEQSINEIRAALPHDRIPEQSSNTAYEKEQGGPYDTKKGGSPLGSEPFPHEPKRERMRRQAFKKNQERQAEEENTPFIPKEEFFGLVEGLSSTHRQQSPPEWKFTVFGVYPKQALFKRSYTRLGERIDDQNKFLGYLDNSRIVNDSPEYETADPKDQPIRGSLRIPKFLFDALHERKLLSHTDAIFRESAPDKMNRMNRIILTLVPADTSSTPPHSFLQVLVVNGKLTDVALYNFFPKGVNQIKLKGLSISSRRQRYNVVLLHRHFPASTTPIKSSIPQHLPEVTVVLSSDKKTAHLIKDGNVSSGAQPVSISSELEAVELIRVEMPARLAKTDSSRYIPFPISRQFDPYGTKLTRKELDKQDYYTNVCLFWWEPKYGTYMEIQFMYGKAYRISPAFWFSPSEYRSAQVVGLKPDRVYIRTNETTPRRERLPKDVHLEAI